MPYFRPFETGDRVYFVRNPKGYTVGESNPLYGSGYECRGTVFSAGSVEAQLSDEESINVHWDNNTDNIYAYACLDLFTEVLRKKKKLEPNWEFLRLKRTRKEK